MTAVEYILATLLTGAIIALILAYIDIQILKSWKAEHERQHDKEQSNQNARDIMLNGTIEKIFNEIKVISNVMNKLIGRFTKDEIE
jgi:phosphate/sulfate permease